MASTAVEEEDLVLRVGHNMISIVVVKKVNYPLRHRPWQLSPVEGGNGMSQELIPTSLKSPLPRCRQLMTPNRSVLYC